MGYKGIPTGYLPFLPCTCLQLQKQAARNASTGKDGQLSRTAGCAAQLCVV